MAKLKLNFPPWFSKEDKEAERRADKLERLARGGGAVPPGRMDWDQWEQLSPEEKAVALRPLPRTPEEHASWDSYPLRASQGLPGTSGPAGQ